MISRPTTPSTASIISWTPGTTSPVAAINLQRQADHRTAEAQVNFGTEVRVQGGFGCVMESEVRSESRFDTLA